MGDTREDGISDKDLGIPTDPAPHEEEAKGTPNDDRLQSEVPPGGEAPPERAPRDKAPPDTAPPEKTPE